MRRRVYVTIGCPSVRPSVCPVDRHLLLAAACARAADIDPQLLAPAIDRYYRSIAAGANAAAAGSVMLRAEVRGSTRTCSCCYADVASCIPGAIFEVYIVSVDVVESVCCLLLATEKCSRSSTRPKAPSRSLLVASFSPAFTISETPGTGSTLASSR